MSKSPGILLLLSDDDVEPVERPAIIDVGSRAPGGAGDGGRSGVRSLGGGVRSGVPVFRGDLDGLVFVLAIIFNAQIRRQYYDASNANTFQYKYVDLTTKKY